MQKQCVRPLRRETLARNRGVKNCTLIFRLFSSKKLQAQGRIYEKMLTFQQVDYIIEKPTKSKRFAAIPVAKQI